MSTQRILRIFDKSKQIPIGKNRRRDRPRLTAPALELQEDEYVLSDTASEDETTDKDQRKKSTKKRKAPVANEDSDYDIFDDDTNEARRSKRLKQASNTATTSKSTKKLQKKQINLKNNSFFLILF